MVSRHFAIAPSASRTIDDGFARAHEIRQLAEKWPLAMHGVKSFGLLASSERSDLIATI